MKLWERRATTNNNYKRKLIPAGAHKLEEEGIVCNYCSGYSVLVTGSFALTSKKLTKSTTNQRDRYRV